VTSTIAVAKMWTCPGTSLLLLHYAPLMSVAL